MNHEPFSSPEEFERCFDVCRRFEEDLRNGLRPSIDEELAKWPESLRPHIHNELSDLEKHHRLNRIETPEAKEYAATAPTLPQRATAPLDHPEKIGRYRVIRILGEGAFGRVYLAHDDELDRNVAVKVPLAKRMAHPENVEAYLKEARVLAALNHPHIVAVFDAGRSDTVPCFVVSKFIEGTDLNKKLKVSWPNFSESTQLVATIADALHYAHRHGLVHRDVKPANILIATDGTAFLADFGLALKDADFGKGDGFAGTPAYMSPEQAQSEGHRVDGRSDIFSLGVVFYELLTKRRPFKADTQSELLEQIAFVEARPPRQIDDGVPKELERICLKAMSKRAADRYTAAKDMAEDLAHFLGGDIKPALVEPTASGPPYASAPAAVPVAALPSSDNRPIKIVPKGLRSFDAHDASFFLELLPGPRDRDGLPDSIRFWKTRIEVTHGDDTFKIGLLYGPSGCGKSSLVKAGLLPRLADAVIAVYLEATAAETESRLLYGLRRQCPALADNLSLKATLIGLRRGQGVPSGKKVLIVLDQFEQWLHAKKDEENPELVQALRQCDGERVQAIVMVRDDFWMAATRFMRELEVRLVEAQNSAAVDLFPVRHAEKVLAAFGRAFGCLSDNVSETTIEQKQFLQQAVAGLAQDGKVISVRLSLFAEMMKGKSWTPAALKEVGGTEGVGVTFLEETFSASTAPPEHRYQQKAARAVLKALLPESGTDIKGHMRSREELLEASGYSARPRDFDDLLGILDGEIRLLTPTDPEGKSSEESATRVQAGAKYYQLTHDYLVPSLRGWLNRKQKETRRGRTELLLADRAAVWSARPENRQLPSLWQWLSIRALTAKKNWTPPQRKMMRTANRFHAVRGTLVAILLTALTFTGLALREQAEQRHKATQAAGLVQAVLNADIAQVPAIIDKMADLRPWTDPALRTEVETAAAGPPRKLKASLALLPTDAAQVGYLFDRLLDAEPHEVSVILTALADHKDVLREQLWRAAQTPERGHESRRLRAAAALAAYDSTDDQWNVIASAVIDDLVRENAIFLGQWSDAFKGVKGRLLAPLSVIYRDRQPERAAERKLATNLLADYAADRPEFLADLLMDADPSQFAVLFPKAREHGEKAVAEWRKEIARQPTNDGVKEHLAQRQANAAVALVRMKQSESVWPLLEHSQDPRVRSYLIHRFAPLGVDAAEIVKRFADEPDLTIRRALILSLGVYDDAAPSADDRQAFAGKVEDIYREDPDPGLHAAAEWLLRTWKREAWLTRTNEEWARAKKSDAERLEALRQFSAKGPRWYVNGQSQTMVVIPGPVEFLMGSPPTEVDRRANESLHLRRISRSFAIAAKPVTMEQYRRFSPKYDVGEPKYHRSGDLPVIGTSWLQAAAYCNWLSEQEGIPKDQWIYEIGEVVVVGLRVVKLRENYLSLTGYRLPTEAEMEYATRAGAETSRYFGETEELLPKYSWYMKNSQEKTWPVGSLKPNDLGLFDAQGNSYTWCQESYNADRSVKDGEALEDKEDANLFLGTGSRVLRGGSFTNQASIVRSALRVSAQPSDRNLINGFRPARTLPPDSHTALPLTK